LAAGFNFDIVGAFFEFTRDRLVLSLLDFARGNLATVALEQAELQVWPKDAFAVFDRDLDIAGLTQVKAVIIVIFLASNPIFTVKGVAVNFERG